MQQLLVKELAEHCGIGTHHIWMDVSAPITSAAVASVEFDGRAREGYRFDWLAEQAPSEHEAMQEHIQRILYHINNPDTVPVHLEEDTFGTIIMDDGYHRLHAAVFMNRLTIAFTWNGTWRAFRDAFPKSYKQKLFRLVYSDNPEEVNREPST